MEAAPQQDQHNQDRITLAVINANVLNLSQKVDEYHREQREMMGRVSTLETSEAGCKADVNGRITALEKQVGDHDERLDSLESSRNTWNLLNSVGVAIVAVIAWLRGGP